MPTITPEALREQLEDLFPLDATCWSQATQEVRDLCAAARGYAGIDDDQAVNFYELRTPSAYNTQGIDGIIRFYSQMTQEQRVEYAAAYQHLWSPESYEE